MQARGLGTADRTLLVVLGIGLKTAVELLVGIALARLLSQTDFGSYRQFLLLVGTLVGLTSLGLPQSLLYFVPKHLESDAPRYVARAFAILLGAVAGGTAVLGLLANPIGVAFNNPDLASLLWLGILYPVGQAVGQCLPFLLLALNRHIEATVASILMALLHGVPIVALAFPGDGLRAVVVAMGLVSAIELVVTLWMARRLMRGRARTASPGVTADLMKYSLPLGLNSMVGTLNQKLDRFIVSFFFNPALLAVYSVGALELPLIPVLPYTVGRVLIPRFVELERDGRRADMLSLWHRSIVKVGLLMMPVFCICFAAAPELVTWLYGPAYRKAAGIFRIYLLLLPLRLTSYGAVLQALGQTGALLRGSLLVILLGPALGVALIQVLGWYGPAVAAVVAQLALIIYLLGRIRLRLRCPWSAVWPWSGMAKLIGASSGAALCGLMTHRLMPPGGLSLPTGITVFLVVFALLAHALGLVDREDWSLAGRWLRLRVFS